MAQVLLVLFCSNTDTISESAAASGPASNGSVAASVPEELRCRLVVDCMGHYGPIVRQLRGTRRPDGMCLVVGACATGYPAHLNTYAT